MKQKKVECQDVDQVAGTIKRTILLQGHMLIISDRANATLTSPASLCARGEVKSFSPSSAARMRRYLRSSVADYKTFITLTYPHSFGMDGKECKRHLDRIVQQFKRYSELHSKQSKDNHSWFWFLEFQSRGAIHFHIFSTEFYPKEWLAAEWFRICGTDDYRHFRAGTRIESIKSGKHGLCAYASKYAAKQAQKELPEDFGWCGRFWGVYGLRATKEAALAYEVGTETSALKRRLETIKEIIKAKVKARVCEKLPVKHDGCTIYIFKKTSEAAELFKAIQIASITANLYSKTGGYFLYPELEELKCC